MPSMSMSISVLALELERRGVAVEEDAGVGVEMRTSANSLSMPISLNSLPWSCCGGDKDTDGIRPCALMVCDVDELVVL